MDHKYKVKLYNDFTSPYFFTEDKELCQHVSFEEYTFISLKLCKQCIKDFLDVPEAELTFEQTKKEWSDYKYQVSDEKIKQIQTYYNGRLNIYNQIMKDLDSFESYSPLDTVERKYSIPHEFNEFVIDENEKLSQQNEAYISISIIPT